METVTNYAVLLAQVASKLKDKKLANIKSHQAKIDILNGYLGLTSMQTVLFIAVYNQSCSDNTANVRDMANFYDVTNMEIMAYKTDLDVLIEKGFIIDSERKISFNRFNEIEFTVNPLVLDAILKNSPVEPPRKEKIKLTQYDFVGMVRELIEQKSRERMSFDEMVREMTRLEYEYPDFPVVTKMKELAVPVIDRILFYVACNRFISERPHRRVCDMDEALKDIYGRTAEVIAYSQSVFDGSSPIMNSKLVTFWREDDGQYNFALALSGQECLLNNHRELFGLNDTGLDNYEFIKKVASYIDERHSRNEYFNNLAEKVEELESKNPENDLVTDLCKHITNVADRVHFYHVCYGCMNGYGDVEDMAEELYQTSRDRMKLQRELKSGAHVLMEQEMIEISEGGFFGEVQVRLTDYGKALFLGADADLADSKKKSSDQICVNDIKQKNLYYSPQIESQVSFLRDSLSEDKFRQLQERLSSQALPSGVAAIFYGSPGTGKTETVYQLAKATGRDVIQVDISQMKTCWYGESQKLVKSVFSRYKRALKNNKLAPILLFNEADAIFGRRSENPEHSVDKTDNAIQNIILEEMEKLEGILIATTNLATNLDPAFERRFLFKICFEKPTVEAKALIWRDKLPTLTESQARELAQTYDFSGGEIDNIVRKATMNIVLYGSCPDISAIHTMCSQERIGNEPRRKRIGF